ncbi:MAG: hypothetical protein EA379_12520 [Phycisphaerales bacterium]|nr:MAG: hypothetical protein EA379_12520 [Phycisphaerales bacterium]
MVSEPTYSDPRDAGALAPVQEEAPVNPVLLVHRALRGRYVPAAVCAVVFGIIGAIVGWSITQPLFASQGWIRAFPRQPRVLYETEENKMLPMFDAFVRSQADLMRSRRVIDLALNEPALREAGWPPAPEGVQQLIDALEVSAARGSELINVTVMHTNPQKAQAAANAVLTAFMRYQEEQESLSATDRERRLRENQQLLSAELRTIRESILRASEQFGGGDPDMLLRARSEQLARIDSMLSDPRLAMSSDAAPGGAPVPDAELSPEELARFDQRLAGLLTQRQNIDLEIQSKSMRLGDSHRDMRALRERRDSLSATIDRRVDELRAAPGRVGDGVALDAANADPAATLQHYQSMRNRLTAEIRDLARARMEIRSLRDREEETETRLADTNKALEVIRVEDEIIRGGRVRIQQRAATPLQPAKDRRMALAAGGFIGGSGAAVGLFVLASFVQRRLRYADELQSVNEMLPLIGVVPEARSDDAEEAQLITIALHHIRNNLLLMRQRNGSRGTVYLITSAVQGEGKTTLGIALSASFAQAGYSTTLVDCDFVGRGMTRELSLDDRPGLADVLSGTPADQGLHPSHIDGLKLMPAGQNKDNYALRMTIEEIRPVIDDLRRKSDIVIVDTGPILGSLEVGLLAQISDAVVLVSARGTGVRLVNAAVDNARRYCKSGVSMVFNRAHHHDLTTSASYCSVHSRNEDEQPARQRKAATDRGRLVRCLAPAESASQDNGTHTP